MSQQNSNRRQSINVTPEQMVNEIQTRIDYLQAVQEAILYGFYGVSNLDLDVEVETAERPAKQRKRRRNASNPAKTHVLITDMLHRRQEPMTLQQIFVELQSLGWKSVSKTPIDVVSVTLAKMRRAGDVSQTDGKWTLTATQPAATVAAAEQAVAA